MLDLNQLIQTLNSFGALFAAMMTGITYLCQRYLKEVQTSEMYMTAQRTVKTGLVASAIVSSWTWAVSINAVSTWTMIS